MGGWGDLSIQPLDGAADQYYEFGVYGSVTTLPTATTAAAYDINTTSCVNRYALVTMYNTEAAAVTAANAAVTAQSSYFYSSLSDFTAPNSPSEFTGAVSSVAVGLATALTLSTLM
mmetsp:Transcript_13220/g.20626  ORF Transcript_13220/g.20626 Transcript_13220/m.20626 type:complete len:116 (-) Transcript_13220:23-370(-)|eukprot:CAMPEP_0170490862 /NCGR_PEP_ID=MMETSP0208-20121228/9927_1 /TAXON_ID=197538 /ORGANISM="Strombidium inclinatum, Strain S3" /LENGTH=115 /DNA_ID=CAMNT_0010766333 /DNA_START=888 /DNA_END=1235 /DNA_ORIENTATION=-